MLTFAQRSKLALHLSGEFPIIFYLQGGQELTEQFEIIMILMVILKNGEISSYLIRCFEFKRISWQRFK